MRRLSDRYRAPALWTLLLGGLVGSVVVTGFTPEKMQTWEHAGEFIKGMFPPDWTILPQVIKGMGETVGIAFLGTFLAFLLAFPLAFFAARNIGPAWLGVPLRWAMAFLRSVPEVLWAILFVVATEFGNIPGVLALAAHNIGILTKLIGEVFEEAPVGTQEAIAATGTGRANVVWFGILPWAMPGILSHTFFRFECNIRSAAILGVVGAGGIGTLLMQHRQLYQYQMMTVDVLGIVALVVLADWLGAAVRKQVS
ncbi:MAG TPA: phosphonate ABC transporter, permease protein PhnE [Symbiobacteriaceae bacterium]|nr:phosphonate ABC transporter, permease protein PhnE [Symbiobacteriaceae bacterium]